MEMVFIIGIMEKFIMEVGIKVKWKVKDNSIGLKELFIEVSIKMIKNMGKVKLYGVIIKDLEDRGHSD